MRPIVTRLTESTSVDDPGFFELVDLERSLRDLSNQFRDTSLDPLVERAGTLAASLRALDERVIKEQVARNGDTDPYGFLTGL